MSKNMMFEGLIILALLCAIALVLWTIPEQGGYLPTQ